MGLSHSSAANALPAPGLERQVGEIVISNLTLLRLGSWKPPMEAGNVLSRRIDQVSVLTIVT